jgi:hypothetical protein
MEIHMRVIGLMINDRVKECSFGLMGIDMMVIGSKAKGMGREKWNMLTEEYTQASGSIISD